MIRINFEQRVRLCLITKTAHFLSQRQHISKRTPLSFPFATADFTDGEASFKADLFTGLGLEGIFDSVRGAVGCWRRGRWIRRLARSGGREVAPLALQLWSLDLMWRTRLLSVRRSLVALRRLLVIAIGLSSVTFHRQIWTKCA